MKIPERWLNYTDCGRIHGTRFIASKVPLREGFNTRLPSSKCYTPAMVLRRHPSLKLMIDITFTTKYYNGEKEFEKNGVQYVKLKCKGREIPSEEIFQRFVSIVDEFIANNPQDYLIGVHCTHGVNRTGYLIVRYMITRLNYTSEKALQGVMDHLKRSELQQSRLDDLENGRRITQRIKSVLLSGLVNQFQKGVKKSQKSKNP